MPRPSKGARLYYARKDDRWVIRDTGRPDVGTGCALGERATAEERLQEYLFRKHKPDFGRGDPAQVSILSALKLYADERAPDTKRADLASSAIVHLGQFFQGRMVAHATPNLCRAYERWRTSQPQARFKDASTAPRVGSQTARRELAILSAAFGYAHKEHKLLYPVPVALPKKAPPRDRWLTRSEAARLIAAALGFRHVASDQLTRREIWRRPGEPGSPERIAAVTQGRHVARFVLLGLYSGTRHNAILRLRWLPSIDAGHIDLRSGILYRRGTAEGETTKRRTPVPLSRRLRAHLRLWSRRNSTYVVEFEGEPLERMRRAWNTARKAAGLGPEVTPHILRHTFCTWAVIDGVPFSKVALAAGTTEKIIEDVYGHHAPEHLRSVVESVSRRR